MKEVKKINKWLAYLLLSLVYPFITIALVFILFVVIIGELLLGNIRGAVSAFKGLKHCFDISITKDILGLYY